MLDWASADLVIMEKTEEMNAWSMKGICSLFHLFAVWRIEGVYSEADAGESKSRGPS